jgi:hypothetical protein
MTWRNRESGRENTLKEEAAKQVATRHKPVQRKKRETKAWQHKGRKQQRLGSHHFFKISLAAQVSRQQSEST